MTDDGTTSVWFKAAVMDIMRSEVESGEDHESILSNQAIVLLVELNEPYFTIRDGCF